MASSRIEIPTWRLSHYVKKLRRGRGWTVNECAYHATLRPDDILSLEAGQPCAPKLLHDRILKLENAFGVNIFNAFENLFRQKARNGESSLIIPFVTPKISIHQNSMEWSRSGVLKDAVELAPHLSVLPQGLLKRFIGRKIPKNFLTFLKRKTRAQVTNAVHSPHALFGHYKRLINASAQSVYTPPLRYEAKLNGADGTVTREVTCVKLSTDAYETQTRVISKNKKLQRAFVDTPCCGEFENCGECYRQALNAAIKAIG